MRVIGVLDLRSTVAGMSERGQLAMAAARVALGRLTGAGEIGVEVGKVISKYKTGTHFDVTNTDDSLAVAAGRRKWFGTTHPDPDPSS